MLVHHNAYQLASFLLVNLPNHPHQTGDRFESKKTSAPTPVVQHPINDVPENPVSHEAMKTDLRAMMEKPVAQDPKLASIMDDVYKENARVGSGSTGDAVRHELKTGEKVGGRDHYQKANDSINRLNKWLNNNPSASKIDRMAAENVLKDLLNSKE